ncbi:MAG: CPBP family intramembrane glutamic endopeptidase [Lachnospiraceae bacterium]
MRACSQEICGWRLWCFWRHPLILEEYFFRGVLYGRCKELVSAPAAAFMTAAFFGVFHWDLVQGIYSFFMGLILAYLMEKTNTVKAPVVFHFAANLAALVLEVF